MEDWDLIEGWVENQCAQRDRRMKKKASRGFEPRLLDSESRVLTVTPRGHLSEKFADHWYLGFFVRFRSSGR